jgi:hypothetical protein
MEKTCIRCNEVLTRNEYRKCRKCTILEAVQDDNQTALNIDGSP